VAFLDVGQGDAAVLRLRDGSVWVVDVGDDRGPGDAARKALVPFLRTRRIRRVDGLILSHRHRDHVGALASFLEAVPVRRVFDAGVGPAQGTSAVVDSLLETHRLWPCLVAAGDTLYAEKGSILIALHPRRGPNSPESYHENLNDASLVVRVEDGAFSLLFAGDIEAAAEAACAENGADIRSTLLKAPHHGSGTSSTEAFLTAVQPSWAVVSVGEHNRFGHPDSLVLGRYRQRGIRVFRTDKDGTVLVRWGKGPPRIRTHPPRPRLPYP
jgi:competence protein ComEC